MSAWGQPNSSRGLLFYCSKYVQETNGFWIRISPKCPHTGWLYRRCPQTPKASQVWKGLRNNGQRTQSAFAFISGRFRATAVGGSLLPLPKRPEREDLTERLNQDRLKYGLCVRSVHQQKAVYGYTQKNTSEEKNPGSQEGSNFIPTPSLKVLPSLWHSEISWYTAPQLRARSSQNSKASTPVTEPHPNKTLR